MSTHTIKHCVLLFIFLFATSCANSNKATSTDPTELQKQGFDAMGAKDYNVAIARFDLIESEYPAYKGLADIMVAKSSAYYQLQKYEQVQLIFDIFDLQYPGYKHADYMYYLNAMTYYKQMVGPQRGQRITQDAIVNFEKLINRFPDSKYSKDAKFKLEFAKNHLAAKEMDVAYFYLHNNDIIGAMRRYSGVVREYQHSIFIQEALYRLVEICTSLGIEKDAKRYFAALYYNYPNNIWTKKAAILLEEIWSDSAL